MGYLTRNFFKVMFLLQTDEGVFPSTFEKHPVIPTREKAKEFYDQLMHFYEEHSDSEIALINRIAQQDWTDEMEGYNRTHTPKQSPAPHPGYIYLLQSQTGYYKIGKTNNPEKRISTLEVKLPFEIEVLALISCPDMRQLETDLHSMFDAKRVNGEWFDLSADDVAYIKGLAE